MNSQGRWYKDQFHLYWLDDTKHIMVIKYTKSYNWHDYYGMMEVAADMVEGVAHPIVYINDFYDNVEIPTRDAYPHYSNMKRMFATPKIVMILRTAQQIQQVKVHSGTVGFIIGEDIWLANSFEEALDIAKQQSERLLNQHAMTGDGADD